MLILLILLAMAYAQDGYGRHRPAYLWAIGFALINLVLGLFGAGFLASFINAIVLGLYAWGYFVLLRRFSDHTLLWLILCVAGLILPFLLPLFIMGALA